MVATRDNFPLLAELLAEQGRLQTPAARAAAAFDESPIGNRLAKIHPELIPLSRPKPGEQYAFQVDLDACSGCKACVAACHSLNGLDETETWRDVGLLVNDDHRHPFQQTVTTACHHCADPGCLNGCPVLAYEKDPVTGIVRHLDDQCIGCQYCILKCPYDAPKYNARLGIVRKCDMCHGRLAAGEAPACAQACPTHAITIVTVPVASEGSAFRVSGFGLDSSSTEVPNPKLRTRNSKPYRNPSDGFLSAAPAPDYTLPTTRYVSRRAVPADARPADSAVLRPQPAHWPLVVMLSLLPAAVGLQGAALAAPAAERGLALAAAIVGAAGLAASVFHLGQPLRAWRIFLGWRRSWLSREAMIFGAWFGAAILAVLDATWLPVAAATGIVGLFCSAMIYIDTRRQFWRASQTLVRFFTGGTLVGAAAALAFSQHPRTALLVLGASAALKLIADARAARPAAEAEMDAPSTPRLATARLLLGTFRVPFGLRIVALVLLAGGLAPAVALGVAAPTWGVVLAGVFAALEFADRHLFFRAVDAPKMPGNATP